MGKIKVCIDQLEALPRNAKGMLVMDRTKMWLDPEVVSPTPVLVEVGFMDGDPDLQKRILLVASEWSKYANVKFVCSGGPLQSCAIRISFKEEGAWSMIGTDALRVAKSKPTMNFGWLEPDSPPLEIQRVVLHEFGHALGCVHEHFHPAGGIPWNTEKVYRWYWDHKGWDQQLVDSQVLRRYSETLTVHSELDRKSIMLYPVDPELTDGKFASDENSELSDMDKAFIARMYPRPS